MAPVDIAEPVTAELYPGHERSVYLTRALGSNRFEVELRARKPARLLGTLRQLGIAGRFGSKNQRPLNGSFVGALRRVAHIVKTRIVFESGRVREFPPQEIVRLFAEQSPIVEREHQVDGRPWMHLYCGDNSGVIIQKLTDCFEVSWSCSLSPIETLRMMQQMAQSSSQMAIVMIDGTLFLDPPIRIPPHINTRSHLVRVIRLENDDESIVWEVPFLGFPAGMRRLQPRKGGRLAGETHYATLSYLSSDPQPTRVSELIETTAAPRVSLLAGHVALHLESFLARERAVLE